MREREMTTKTEMGCGADCCGKAFLVILNIFILIIGIAFLGGGLFLKFGQTILMPTMSSLLDGALSQAKASGVSTGSVDDFVGIFNIAAYVLIALGAFCFLVALCGCAGACCSVKCFLGFYAAAVLLIFVAQIVLIAILASKALDKKMFAAMQTDLYNKYEGPAAFNAESLLLNAIMVQLKCCGIESYTEFTKAVNWNRTLSYTSSGTTYTVDQQIPMTCCKVTGTFPSVTPDDETCTRTPTSVNSNIDSNCHSAVQTQIDQYKIAIYGTYAGILAFELLCGMVAICLLVRLKNKENKVHPEGGEDKNNKRN